MSLTNITYPYPTKTIKTEDSCEIHYMEAGKGEKTLVFIHGLGNYAPVWTRNFDVLKEHYRCIAIDLPGYGLSDKNNHKFGIPFFADALFHFLEDLRIQNPVIVGHSMGGMVALRFAIKYPGIAEKLVLCAPAGFEVFSAMERTMYYSMLHMVDMVTSDEFSLAKTLEMSFHNYAHQADGLIKDLVNIMKLYPSGYYKKLLDASIRSMLEDEVYNELGKIDCPVSVLFGKNDALIPNKLIHRTSTEQLAQEGISKLKNARLKMVPNCGHFVHWECAETTNEEIRTFVS